MSNGPTRGNCTPAERFVFENSRRLPPAKSLPANSKYTENGCGPEKMKRLVNETSCFAISSWVPPKKPCTICLNDWPPAAPPPNTITRLAPKDQPEFSGEIPKRKPANLGYPADSVPSVSSILSVYDMRAANASYCIPRRVKGS